MAALNQNMNIVNLPDVVLEKILRFMTYDEIAKTRIVCQRFNAVCQNLLNRGFAQAVHFHAKCFKEVKSQLPRRESKRSNHPLAHHNNILNAIETRLSLLKMTYCKYVQYNVCCFIPGKVIDELFRVLNLVNGTEGSPIPHEILTELRDISSMAMDYFEEKIVPNLQKTLSSQKQLSACSSSVVPDAQSSHRSGHASSSPCGEAGSSQDGVDRSSLSSYITGGGSYFSFTDNLLDLEMRSAFDILTAPSRNAEPAGFNSGSMMLVPVPAETLKALVAALKETKAKKNKLERSLSLLQTKVVEVSRKLRDQERTISEQSRLLTEHCVRFTHHNARINEIVNCSVRAEVLDLEAASASLLGLRDSSSPEESLCGDDDLNPLYGKKVHFDEGSLADNPQKDTSLVENKSGTSSIKRDRSAGVDEDLFGAFDEENMKKKPRILNYQQPGGSKHYQEIEDLGPGHLQAGPSNAGERNCSQNAAESEGNLGEGEKRNSNHFDRRNIIEDLPIASTSKQYLETKMIIDDKIITKQQFEAVEDSDVDAISCGEKAPHESSLVETNYKRMDLDISSSSANFSFGGASIPKDESQSNSSGPTSTALNTAACDTEQISSQPTDKKAFLCKASNAALPSTSSSLVHDGTSPASSFLCMSTISTSTSSRRDASRPSSLPASCKLLRAGHSRRNDRCSGLLRKEAQRRRGCLSSDTGPRRQVALLKQILKQQRSLKRLNASFNSSRTSVNFDGPSYSTTRTPLVMQPPILRTPDGRIILIRDTQKTPNLMETSASPRSEDASFRDAPGDLQSQERACALPAYAPSGTCSSGTPNDTPRTPRKGFFSGLGNPSCGSSKDLSARGSTRALMSQDFLGSPLHLSSPSLVRSASLVNSPSSSLASANSCSTPYSSSLLSSSLRSSNLASPPARNLLSSSHQSSNKMPDSALCRELGAAVQASLELRRLRLRRLLTRLREQPTRSGRLASRRISNKLPGLNLVDDAALAGGLQRDEGNGENPQSDREPSLEALDAKEKSQSP